MGDFTIHNDGTISLNYQNISLIQLVDIFDDILKEIKIDPIKRLKETAKIINGCLIFSLGINSSKIKIDLNNCSIPPPNVNLTERQYSEYQSTLELMISSYRSLTWIG